MKLRLQPLRMSLTALTATIAITLPERALAHEGHGMGGGSHWHATDAWGLVIGAAAVAVVFWLGRRQ